MEVDPHGDGGSVNNGETDPGHGPDALRNASGWRRNGGIFRGVARADFRRFCTARRGPLPCRTEAPPLAAKCGRGRHLPGSIALTRARISRLSREKWSEMQSRLIEESPRNRGPQICGTRDETLANQLRWVAVGGSSSSVRGCSVYGARQLPHIPISYAGVFSRAVDHSNQVPIGFERTPSMVQTTPSRGSANATDAEGSGVELFATTDREPADACGAM